MFPSKQSEHLYITLNSGIKKEIEPIPVNDTSEYFI